MKPHVYASQEITNEYLGQLFDKLDFDDYEYADKLIDRVLKKNIPVDITITGDTAKYINMLDGDVKSDLMGLLENPKALHEKRMKGKKKPKKTRRGSRVALEAKYEDLDGNLHTVTVSGSDRLEALKKLVDSLYLYTSVDDIEGDNLSYDDVIEELASQNGVGYDYIINLKDKNTGEVLMDCPYEEEPWVGEL